jgi:hypothetical protein
MNSNDPAPAIPTAQAPVRTPWVEAELRVGHHVAPYRIAGDGPLVLALTRQPEAHFLGHCERMARTARVVMPCLRDSSDGRAAWLAALTEVFGADQVRLVADHSATIDAVALALASPGRVAAIQIVWHGAGRAEGAGALLFPALGRCLVPVSLAGYIDR